MKRAGYILLMVLMGIVALTTTAQDDKTRSRRPVPGVGMPTRRGPGGQQNGGQQNGGAGNSAVTPAASDHE